MAEISNSEQGKPKKHARLRSRKMSTRVDLTPMVDLAFLLITFFMLTTSLQQSKAMELDKRIPIDNPEPVPDCAVLNILLDTLDRVYTYTGNDLSTLKASSYSETNGIRQALMQKRAQVKNECHTSNGRNYDIIVFIKAMHGSRYQNLINTFDEVSILQIKGYSMPEPSDEEIEAVKKKQEI